MEDAPRVSECSQLAEKLLLIATLLYLYRYVGDYIFTSCFLRQLAYVFQTIRIVLTLAGLLPFVIHGQLNWFLPELSETKSPHITVISIAANIAVAMTLSYIIHAGIKAYVKANSFEKERQQKFVSRKYMEEECE